MADGPTVWIGSDTQATDTQGDVNETGPKFSVHDGWAIGVAGCHFTANLIAAEIGGLVAGLTDVRSPAWEFTGRLSQLFRDYDYTPKEQDTGSPQWGGWYILAGHGRVWALDSCLSPLEYHHGQLVARGSGMDFARGVGFAMRQSDMPPSEIVGLGIEAAIAFDSGCGGNVWVERLGPPGLTIAAG
ncbi:MAG: hypothetical protein ACR2RE_30190 [Geminicoccaceae bacterium]